MTVPSHSIRDCRKQRTLQKESRFSGIGIHTGAIVDMRFLPAKEGTGIVFRRTDLPGQPEIPADLHYVVDTSRSTTIGIGSVKIHTVEHVLAALRAYEVDNAIIEVSNVEPPIGNGSSDLFVQMIEEAGIEEQPGEVPIVKIEQPVFWSEKDVHIVALPCDDFKISYALSYSGSPILQSQYFSLNVDRKSFKQELASCRTFSLYEEVSMLMDRGLIKGGSLDNAVIIKGSAVFSKGGLFFKNEMCRHKILDLIGDLSLVGVPFQAHIISIKSGHASNYAFAKQLLKYITSYKLSPNRG